jgi:hypothetical protein
MNDKPKNENKTSDVELLVHAGHTDIETEVGTLPMQLSAIQDDLDGVSDVEKQERNKLGNVLVPLMKGIVYEEADAKRWTSLLVLRSRVQDHVGVLGLELILDEAEGYAFLRSRQSLDDSEEVPRLMAKRALSFPVSLLIALLRKRLVESDVAGGDTRLVLTRDDIVDMLRLFLPDNSNEAKLIDQIDTHIKKVIDLGFMRKMNTGSSADKVDRYEVKRVIKAFVDGQWLSSLNDRLEEYAAHLCEDEDAGDDARVDSVGALAKQLSESDKN